MCECLEYDDGSMYLCEACTGEWMDAQGDLALLREENERLKDELGGMALCHGLHESLKAENARLKSLVREARDTWWAKDGTSFAEIDWLSRAEKELEG